MRPRILCLAACIVGLCAPAGADTFSLRNVPGVDAGGWGAPQTAPPAWLTPEQPEADQPKSKGKAAMYSLLVPGWGHYYAGDKKGARGFFVAEVATWTAFIVFEVQGRLREDGYIDYAQVFAGVGNDDHSDDYWALISEYDSWLDYETAVKTEGRFALYPEGDAATLEEYFVQNRISDFEPWEWSDSDARRDYRGRRSDSKSSYRNALYTVAFGMVNRVASAFFAIKAVNESNEALEGSRVGYHLEIGAPVVRPEDGPQTGLTFVATF